MSSTDGMQFLCSLTACVSTLAVGLAPGLAFAEESRLRADLATVARRSVFFGHQSVGTNILDGVRQLADGQGMALRVEEVKGTAGVSAGTLAHGFMAENGDPHRKLESFQRALGEGPGASVDLALIKFCFADFTPTTDVGAIFARYQAVIGALMAAHPRTTFIHATVPLTGVQGGFKGALKRLLGRAPYGLAENARREEYNQLVRLAYQGKEPLFDVARVESTAPDGRIETVDWSGRAIPALVPAYTNDGGHLSGEGQLVVARELLAVLAAAPVRRAPPAAAR